MLVPGRCEGPYGCKAVVAASAELAFRSQVRKAAAVLAAALSPPRRRGAARPGRDAHRRAGPGRSLGPRRGRPSRRRRRRSPCPARPCRFRRPSAPSCRGQCGRPRPRYTGTSPRSNTHDQGRSSRSARPATPDTTRASASPAAPPRRPPPRHKRGSPTSRPSSACGVSGSAAGTAARRRISVQRRSARRSPASACSLPWRSSSSARARRRTGSACRSSTSGTTSCTTAARAFLNGGISRDLVGQGLRQRLHRRGARLRRELYWGSTTRCASCAPPATRSALGVHRAARPADVARPQRRVAGIAPGVPRAQMVLELAAHYELLVIPVLFNGALARDQRCATPSATRR